MNQQPSVYSIKSTLEIFRGGGPAHCFNQSSANAGIFYPQIQSYPLYKRPPRCILSSFRFCSPNWALSEMQTAVLTLLKPLPAGYLNVVIVPSATIQQNHIFGHPHYWHCYYCGATVVYSCYLSTWLPLWFNLVRPLEKEKKLSSQHKSSIRRNDREYPIVLYCSEAKYDITVCTLLV